MYQFHSFKDEEPCSPNSPDWFHDGISPQTPYTASPIDSSDASCYDFGGPNTNTRYNPDTGLYNPGYSATMDAGDSNGYQSNSYSTVDEYHPSQSQIYTNYTGDMAASRDTTKPDIPGKISLTASPGSTSPTPGTSTAGDGFVCFVKGCESKTLFKRQADLQRHYQHRHAPNDKKKYFCDYKKCVRGTEPFHRVDHLRDHYRDFHNENLTHKTGEKPEWYESRNISTKWWRCAKCLGHNQITEHGWVCAKCGSHCDANRRALRGYK